ncbi:MAG TPA: hypothetical protein VG944_15400 [Fimbriimonas sp.]|nr:hypothetical protein [Fimbriimonas sp.]
MRTVNDSPEISEDHLEIVKNEYEAASRAYMPMSRHTLARHLSTKTGMPYKTALTVVDTYCEQNSVPVPDFLGREFNVGWLKVVSLASVVLTGILCWYGRSLHLQKQNPIFMWILAFMFGSLAVVLWIKSLEAEVSNAKSDIDPAKEELRAASKN